MNSVLRVCVLHLSLAIPALGQSGRAVPECAPLHSTVLSPSSANARRTESVVFRSLVDTATSNLSRLEVHITTLAEGKSPHPPHRHPHEELMIVQSGQLEALQGDTTRRAGPGSVIFEAANELHGLHNPGPGPATYVVIRVDPHDLVSPDSPHCRAATH